MSEYERDFKRLLKVADAIQVLNKFLIGITGVAGYQEGPLEDLDELYEVLLDNSNYPDDTTKVFGIIDNEKISIDRKYELLYKPD